MQNTHKHNNKFIFSTLFISVLFLISFSLPFISAEATVLYDSPNLPKVEYSPPEVAYVNYTSLNVNDSHYLEGRDTAALYIYFQGLFDNIYCKLVGCNMTGDIEMNDNHITEVGGIYFNTTHVSEIVEEGVLHWDDDMGTLSVGLGGGNVNLQLGVEQIIKVRNSAGYDIENGKVVYITGSQGETPTVEYSDMSDSDSISILGMATENISDGSQGYVTRRGLVHDVDTSGWDEGDKLYLNSNGSLTNHHPTGQIDATVIVGFVIKSAVDGIILVAPESFTIGNNFNGTLRQSIINKNASGGSGFVSINDVGAWMTIGIAGSNNPGFPGNATISYGSGYGDHLMAVDGNKSFIWYNDPEDRHTNGALEYENMRLTADGSLSVRNTVNASVYYGDGSQLTGLDKTFDTYETGNFNGSIYNKPSSTNSSASDSNSLFQIVSDTRGTPQFQVQDGGPNQASFIVRSFIVVNQNNTLLNMSINNICGDWGFMYIDCNTSTTGADFGVTDDIEAKGLIYSKSGFRAYVDKQSAFFVASKNTSAIYSGKNGSYNNVTSIFCDYTSNNFALPADGWIEITTLSGGFEGAIANYGTYINSSCIGLYNNPGWKTNMVAQSWKLVNNPDMVIVKGGLMQYNVGTDEKSTFEVDISNGTGAHGFYVDDVVGKDGHKGVSIEQDLNGKLGTALNIFVYSSNQLVQKSLTMISLEADASKMNSSDGVFIDMSIIGQPLTADGHIDGIHMPAGLTHLVEVGSAETVRSAYYNSVNITPNVTNGGNDPIVFINDNDILYIGANNNFSVLTIALSRISSSDIDALFYYCNISGGWQTLPGISDSTNGFRVSGTISFSSPTNRGKCNKQIGGAAFGNTTNYTYIAIQRTRNFIVTPPIIDRLGVAGGSTSMFLSEDILRLSPVDTAPELCSASTLGGMYFDISEDAMCSCRSTGWTVISDGSPCT